MCACPLPAFTSLQYRHASWSLSPHSSMYFVLSFRRCFSSRAVPLGARHELVMEVKTVSSPVRENVPKTKTSHGANKLSGCAAAARRGGGGGNSEILWRSRGNTCSPSVVRSGGRAANGRLIDMRPSSCFGVHNTQSTIHACKQHSRFI